MAIIVTKDIIDPTKYQLPADQYVARITKFENKNSNAGNPMTELQCEIMSPESFEHGGVTVPCAMRQFRLYLMWTPGKAGTGVIDAVNALYKLGWPKDADFDPDIHAKELFDNCYFKVSLEGRPRFKTTDGKFHTDKEEQFFAKDADGKKILECYDVDAVRGLKAIIGRCDPEGNPF